MEQAGQHGWAKIKLPGVMVGKRAFVRAVAHLVRGSAVHQLWELPQCKAYSAEEWEAKQVAEAAAGDGDGDGDGKAGETAAAAAAVAGAAGGSRAGTPTLGSRPGTPALSTEAGDAAAVDGSAVNDVGPGSLELALVEAAGAAKAQQQQQQPPGRGKRSETLREKLRVSRSLERERITFGKSGIHGWGIFARQPIKQDSLVSEFRGQVVRGVLADVREAGYKKQVRGGAGRPAARSTVTVLDRTG